MGCVSAAKPPTPPPPALELAAADCERELHFFSVYNKCGIADAAISKNKPIFQLCLRTQLEKNRWRTIAIKDMGLSRGQKQRFYNKYHHFLTIITKSVQGDQLELGVISECSESISRLLSPFIGNLSELTENLILTSASSVNPHIIESLGVTCIISCAPELPDVPLPHESYNYVKLRRTRIRPNCGFFTQLIKYEKQLYGTNSVRMVFNELVQMEIPNIYESEYRSHSNFVKKRNGNGRH
ncbi:hypothetical protein NQ318_020002 [Aromia moschata]|uniref:Uncharacterized protein n=1 Tax=Aromia moschata TaxID=1265417 RepID=A0AAV8ZAV6_9CUCU|nr:hypothetical protein NQ318_020002 [Aromia moschata]